MKKLTTISLVLLLISTMVAKPTKNKTMGNQETTLVTKTQSIANVTTLDVSKFAAVEIEYSNENTITIITNEHNQNDVKAETSGNQLKLYVVSSNTTVSKKTKKVNINNANINTTRAIIKTNQINTISLDKVASFTSNNAYQSTNFSLTTTATAKINLNINCDNLNINTQSTSNIDLTETTKKSTIVVKSTNKLDMTSLESETTEVYISSCNKHLYKEKTLWHTSRV
ncbi:MAG: DUF2807 domain-containing protein [Chitinophagales bacterium]